MIVEQAWVVIRREGNAGTIVGRFADREKADALVADLGDGYEAWPRPAGQVLWGPLR